MHPLMLLSTFQNTVYWPGIEKWLQQRFKEIHPGYDHNVRYRILGYQWRVLRFNDNTRQSTVKLMAAYDDSDPGSVFFMQQAHCLAVPCKSHPIQIELLLLHLSLFVN